MPTFIDTNVLLRAVQPSHPMHAAAVRALELLMKREEPLFIAVQNIAEFWNVATRPAAVNGLGFTIEEALERRVSGVQVHDARLAAVMKAHGLARIVTFNGSDFDRFPDIEAVHPDELD